MPVTKDQAHMLAALARGIQAETFGKAQSDEPGIVASLEPVAHMSLAEVMRAVSRWAEDLDAKTPGLLKDTRSSCWRERSERRPTPRPGPVPHLAPGDPPPTEWAQARAARRDDATRGNA